MKKPWSFSRREFSPAGREEARSRRQKSEKNSSFNIGCPFFVNRRTPGDAARAVICAFHKQKTRRHERERRRHRWLCKFCACCSVRDIALFLRKFFVKAQTVKGFCRHVARCCRQGGKMRRKTGEFFWSCSVFSFHPCSILCERVCGTCGRCGFAPFDAQAHDKRMRRVRRWRIVSLFMPEAMSRGVPDMLGKRLGLPARRGEQLLRGRVKDAEARQVREAAVCRRVKRKRERILLSSPALLRLRPDAD